MKISWVMIYYLLVLGCFTTTLVRKEESMNDCVKIANNNPTRLSTNIMIYHSDGQIDHSRKPELKSRIDFSPTDGIYYYRIENMPICSEISKDEIKNEIDLAADEWNKVEANVLLVNVDNVDIESQASIPGEKTISLSFEQCNHKKDRNNPQSDDNKFISCDKVFAHAFIGQRNNKVNGDIHFNTKMTWTSSSMYSVNDFRQGDLLKANLYNIALHEFGHSLGLLHSSIQEDVMYWNFGGNRRYKKLTITKNDEQKLVRVYYPRKPCMDYSIFCSDLACDDDSEIRYCPKVCGLCHECDEPVLDQYLKCNKDICNDKNHEMRQYCTKTCKLCKDPCIDKKKNCERMLTKSSRNCTQKNMKKRCRKSCGLC